MNRLMQKCMCKIAYFFYCSRCCQEIKKGRKNPCNYEKNHGTTFAESVSILFYKQKYISIKICKVPKYKFKAYLLILPLRQERREHTQVVRRDF